VQEGNTADMIFPVGRVLGYLSEMTALNPDDVTEAQRLLDTGLRFAAHEVLEASWKAAPTRSGSSGAGWPSWPSG
jgi:hypothetical protein